MKSILRFLVGIIPATLLFIIAPLFPVAKRGEFTPTRGHIRLLALWCIGFEGFQ